MGKPACDFWVEHRAFRRGAFVLHYIINYIIFAEMIDKPFK